MPFFKRSKSYSLDPLKAVRLSDLSNPITFFSKGKHSKTRAVCIAQLISSVHACQLLQIYFSFSTIHFIQSLPLCKKGKQLSIFESEKIILSQEQCIQFHFYPWRSLSLYTVNQNLKVKVKFSKMSVCILSFVILKCYTRLSTFNIIWVNDQIYLTLEYRIRIQ